MKTFPSVYGFIAAIAVMVSLTACAFVAPGQPAKAVENKLLPINSIVVMPAEMLLAHDHGDLDINTHQLEEGVITFDGLLAEYFEKFEGVKVLTQGRKESMAGEFTGSRLAVARGVGKKLQSDAVLITTVNRYVPRKGTKYSVERPASVAFDYRLIAVETGQTLCAGVYDQTQHPVMDNIFAVPKAFGRGFKWISAVQLASEGVGEKFNKCPYLKRKENK